MKSSSPADFTLALYTLFTPTGDQAQYAICSPITDEYGTVYFKNDSAHLMAFGSKIVSLDVTVEPEKMVYREGESFDPEGMTVMATYANGKTRDVTAYVTDCGGILHERKYTEYPRVILTVTAMGGDARNVAGYDLTAPLEDYEQTIFQGVNGAIYALLALDSGNYGSEAIRERYIAHILEKELPDGGWCMMGDVPEADVTAMALQALAKYRLHRGHRKSL